MLRNFPHVLLIDTEGNSDQCVDMAEIPLFLRKKTKDAREIVKIIDQVAEGKIKFPDGSPVETVSIDSATVLWSVGQEAVAASAEARAIKYHKPLDNVTPAASDWNIGKRPIKRIYNRLSNSPIKYLFLICREKTAYDPSDENKSTNKKPEYTPDTMKGLDYDMSISFHLSFDDLGKWQCKVSQVRGKLNEQYPIGKVMREFPAKDLITYAEKYATAKAGNDEDDEELGRKMAQAEVAGKEPHDKQALMAFARTVGINSPEAVGDILKANELVPYDEANWDKMTAAVVAAAPQAQ